MRKAIVIVVSLALASSCFAVTGTERSDETIAGIERSSQIEELMQTFHVPGVSVAVIGGYRILWAKGYGVTKAGGSEPVTPDTVFLAGSISKPVAAVGALALVDSGQLSLDDDVSVRLKSWRLPSSSYTQSVTLGRLLDHTAGFTGGEFYPGYAAGASVPALAQILAGSPPATNGPVHLGFEPGSRWQYSGDGYLVMQLLVMDTTGKPFAEFMHDTVFGKIGMARSTFEQPLPEALAGAAAAGTEVDGTPVPGGWHVSPELAAAGLWSTPSDLARLAIEIALSAHGKANHALSQRTAADMLAAHVSEGVVNILGTPEDADSMGYGFFVGAKTRRFGHIGGHVGYQATLVMFADSGNGAVIMTNSDHGLHAGNALLNAIAKAYQWNYTAPKPPGF